VRLLLLLLLLGTAAPLAATAGEAAEDAFQALRRAVREGDPRERVLALRQVQRAARDLPPADRRRAAVDLRKVFRDEADDAVRGEMVRTLSRLGGKTGWMPVLLAHDEARDEATQGAARQAVLWGGGDYLATVEEILGEEKDPSFRARLLLLLGDRRKADAVPLLLAGLLDPESRVVAAAAEALEAITKRAFGYDREAWAGWWEREGRDALLAPTAPPTPNPSGESVTVAPVEDPPIPEPPPHVTQSLVPDFYGLRLTSKDLVFVIDISGSVGAGGVTKAKRELVEAVERLGSDVRVTALFFAEETHIWKRELVPATPTAKAELSLFLRAIEPGRRTDVLWPVNAGLDLVRDRVAAKEAAGEPFREAVTLIVVSDGVDTRARDAAELQRARDAVADKLYRLDPARTVVHAIVLGGKPSQLMADIARQGGGRYVVVP
jgi:hypothetical protein